MLKYQNFPLDENSISQQALMRTIMSIVMTEDVTRQQGLGGRLIRVFAAKITIYRNSGGFHFIATF